MGFDLTTLMAIDIDCTGSCKNQQPNDHEHESPTGNGAMLLSTAEQFG
jgi:hypothetical protein